MMCVPLVASLETLRRSVILAAVTLSPMALGHCAKKADEAAGPGRADGYDVIVVGSGAGGGPLAARLARAGKHVLLVEAGEDVGDRAHYRVPAMHALSTEDPALAWWYFVKHSSDASIDASDSKITKEGILYPRGSALGGSTAVNAMVTVLPSPSDWDGLAMRTGDRSFRASKMAVYEDRVREWLSVSLPDPALALGDTKLSALLRGAAEAAAANDPDVAAPGAMTTAGLSTLLSHDVNDALRRGEATGLFRLPLATADGARNGPREHLLRTVAEGYPLEIRTSTFVTRVLWSDDAKRATTAVGVEVIPEAHVYGASLAKKRPASDPERVYVKAGGEIVLAAGTFNSPQILALSGVGDRAALEKLGVDVVVDRKGVGKNLQDRYEAAVVSELGAPLDVIAPCTLGAKDEEADPCFKAWESKSGVYTTPGFLATVLHRSSQSPDVADLQIFGAPTDARGYYPGYSADAAKAKDRFTWLLLKAHTKNTDGTVELASADPLARPNIHFHSYDENAPLADPDLLALVDGVRTVRDMLKRARAIMPETAVTEVWPGPSVATDEAIAKFVRKEWWGHHACCTNKMGAPEDETAVVDAEFRVIGTEHLRVVDASVFPEIPGTFIAMPTYMLAEKAADAILEGGAR